MRFGLHSGPVTAGVLRGERARFQLFGDTVNTTARVETTGEKGRIHISQDTADLIIAAGKSRWNRKREDKVVAKGKGQVQTYWLDTRGTTATTGSVSSGSEQEELEPFMGARILRLAYQVHPARCDAFTLVGTILVARAVHGPTIALTARVLPPTLIEIRVGRRIGDNKLELGGILVVVRCQLTHNGVSLYHLAASTVSRVGNLVHVGIESFIAQ
jgi:hypothetical protein